MKNFRVLSLFSGAGGLDYGFKKQGFDIVWANDFDKYAVETYKKNIGNHIILGDITKIKDSGLPDNIDVVLGGFPCQGFSVANNKRSMTDQRNFLYLEMIRIIKEKKPKIFVAENVKGLASMESGKVLKMIIKDFTDLGYKVDYKILNSVNYGVPQNRERIVIIGNRMNIDNIFPKEIFESGNNEINHYYTVEESIGFLRNVDLNEKPIYLKKDNRTILNHIASENVLSTFWKRKYPFSQHELADYLKYWRVKKNISVKKIDELFGYKYTAGHWFRKDNNCGSIPKPHDWVKLKKILGFDDKFDENVLEFEEIEIKFEQSLRITNWTTPSDTITASQPEIHIDKKRRLSVRECAILQSFPDDFEFCGSRSTMYKQIGNAVPPLMAENIAKSILKMFEDKKREKKCNLKKLNFEKMSI